jgi:hypothetical protein
MSLSFVEIQAIGEMAKLLYNFLPGKPHPYANQKISFLSISNELGLGLYWMQGSKLPAITTLLQSTLEQKRGSFCPLILEVVKRGIVYRNGKNDGITREEIEALNRLIKLVGLKIPELWELNFLESLTSKKKVENVNNSDSGSPDLTYFNEQFRLIMAMDPNPRGFAFEQFLNELFNAFGLSPNGSFRIVGEQIDGSFLLDGETYLIEAKWHNKQINNSDLLIFRGKVDSKATWARGLYISFSGFTPDGLEAFSKGKATNIVGMTGLDIHYVLEGKISLAEMIRFKVRKTVETGAFYVGVEDII